MEKVEKETVLKKVSTGSLQFACRWLLDRLSNQNHLSICEPHITPSISPIYHKKPVKSAQMFSQKYKTSMMANSH